MLQIRDMAIKRGTNMNSFGITLPYLSLAKGEVVAITGASGCGKSTVLEMIGLILAPSSLGSFFLGENGEMDVAALIHGNHQTKLADIRSQKLGFVLQTGGLLPFLSVVQNIQLPRRMLGLPPHCELVEDAIFRLSLNSLLEHKPSQLSIGERQRVAFVRAIAHEPDLLLADEPTGALDPINAQKLFELIVDIVQRFQISALLVTHDWHLVSGCAIRNLHGEVDSSTSISGAIFHDSK
jgi:putative ABC transport system ATP-binding protein